MSYPWRSADHKTFVAYFPDGVSIVDVVDVVYTELLKRQPTADVRFSTEPFVDLCNIDVRVGDVEDKNVPPQFVEDMWFSFLSDPVGSRTGCSGINKCEGKFTEASEAGLLAALNVFGGDLTVRSPGSMNDIDTEFPVTAYAHEKSPFFQAVCEVRKIMPLHGACEVIKAAQVPEKRKALLDIIGASAGAST